MSTGLRERGEDARKRVGPRAADIMRYEIDAAGGSEVFFAATLDDSGLVAQVRVLARGHASAVPAILEGLKSREVVIHNHPTGDLEPSDADLDLASVYSQHGHGVFIVDNALERVYAVIEPFTDEPRLPLETGSMESMFRVDGPLARVLSNFEVRPQQIEMMEAVTDSLNHDAIAVIEAPTGVGKTVAYLVPAVEWALNNRERVVISTRTINLQEQIVFKDIPQLERAFDRPFKTVLVKGRSNYLCPRKMERARSESELFGDEQEREELTRLDEWARKTEDGSRSELSWRPSPGVWERVCSDSDTCTTAQCNAAGNCFVTRARREIAKADILVVNHHMLFSDLRIKRELGQFQTVGILPSYQRLIIDEAHHIEDSATEYFGTEATRNGAMAMLGRLARMERGRDRGLLAYIRLRLSHEAKSLSALELEQLLDSIETELIPALETARQSLETAFAAIRDYTAANCGQVGRDIKWRLTDGIVSRDDFRRLHAEQVAPAVEALQALVQRCSALHRKLRQIEPESGQDERPLALESAQLNGIVDRIVRLGNTLAEATSDRIEDNTVRWIEIDAQNARIVRLVRSPLEIAKPMQESVYPHIRTIAMTSATLSVAGEFGFFRDRLGLTAEAGRDVQETRLDSPFDFESQSMAAVVADAPAPDHPDFLAACSDTIEEILAITGGHAFILFTSFYALNEVYKRIATTLERRHIPVLRQGDAPRSQLLDRFRSDAASVLLGTDSFWEGVDVPGDALQCVILPRLPFRVPTEPILQARAESIEIAGGNAFMDYTVPMAVIKFRQGIGRLIRRRSDRGSIVVLDSRVVTKRYGRIFLDSLHGVRLVKGPQTAILMALRNFHQGTAEES